MVKYLAIYIQLNYWAYGEPVASLEKVWGKLGQFPYSPLNTQERVQFIMNTPDHHHSFTALSQLYSELEKKLAVFHFKQEK
ncbi:MAG: hypothetical protein LRY73_13040 [Bacillus sp. (in: Bacteria)]|nr:hypothetical protein [Bacillus sp. (in: firmicutes)]